MAGRDDGVRVVAQQVARHAGCIAAPVPDDAAADRRVEADVVPHGVLLEREAHPYDPGVADGALGDQVLGPLPAWGTAVHEGLEHLPVRALGGVADDLDLPGCGHQRLLAEYVFAGVEDTHGPLSVQPVRERDVDRVDAPVGEQRVVGPVVAGRSPSPGLGGGDIGATARDRLQGGVGCPDQPREKRLVDPGRIQHTPSHPPYRHRAPDQLVTGVGQDACRASSSRR